MGWFVFVSFLEKIVIFRKIALILCCYLYQHILYIHGLNMQTMPVCAVKLSVIYKKAGFSGFLCLDQQAEMQYFFFLLKIYICISTYQSPFIKILNLLPWNWQK